MVTFDLGCTIEAGGWGLGTRPGGACAICQAARASMFVVTFDLALLLLSLACTSNLEETCSRNESDCDKGVELAEANKGMTKLMSLLAAGDAERIAVDGSEDIFVSIKTTEKYHGTRLPPLVFTWLQTLQPEQVGVVAL